MMGFQKISTFRFFGGTAAGSPGRRLNFFSRQNLRNNILEKVKKFGYRVTIHLEAVDRNIMPWVIFTPPLPPGAVGLNNNVIWLKCCDF